MGCGTARLYWENPSVILSKSIFPVLVGDKHETPYNLLWMDAADSSVVVRALLPLTEGVAEKLNNVYAYDLETT